MNNANSAESRPGSKYLQFSVVLVLCLHAHILTDIEHLNTKSVLNVGLMRFSIGTRSVIQTVSLKAN